MTSQEFLSLSLSLPSRALSPEPLLWIIPPPLFQTQQLPIPIKFKERDTSPNSVADVILVKFKLDTPVDKVNSIIASVGAEIVKHFKFIRTYHLKLSDNIPASQAIEILQENPAVEYAEPDHVYQANDY